MALIRISVYLAMLPRAIQAQFDCSKVQGNIVVLPCLTGADLAYAKALSVRASVELVSNIAKFVTLAVALSDERFAAQMCGYSGS